MKATITLLLTLLTAIRGFTQNVDWINAPMNPIALKHRLEHFNLKGDVFRHDAKYFDKEGRLLRNTSTGEKYSYKDGKLEEYSTNEAGYITDKGDFKYTYNSKGLLTAAVETIKQSGKDDVVNQNKYTYDDIGRLASEERIKNGTVYRTHNYIYEKTGDVLQVKETVKEETKQPYQNIKHFKNGKLVYSRSGNDVIELKIVSKTDAKGNSIKDDYHNINTQNNKTVTDEFDYTIVYYSDAQKPTTYTVVLKKGYGDKLYQHIYKNGAYFASDLKHQLNNSNDLIYYDELTQTYYLAKNAYNSTLTEGSVIKTEIISKGREALIYIAPGGNQTTPYVNGKKALAGLSTSSVKLFNDRIFVYYVENSTRHHYTLCFPYTQGQTFMPGEQLAPGVDNLYFFYDNKRDTDVLVKNGVPVAEGTFSGFGDTESGGMVAFVNGKPYYTFPDYYSAEDNKVYPARYYDPKKDILVQNEKTQAGKASPTQTNASAGSASTDDTDPYSGLSTDAATYMTIYRMTPKGLKSYLGNQHNNWEQNGYSAEKISQSYADMFKEVYAKDKKAAFELIIHMPDSWLANDKLKSVFSLLTKEQQLYIQEEANRR